MENKHLTVSQLNNYLKQIIDSEYLIKNITIAGEVSGFSISRNIAYFSLKDENSIISIVMFDAENKYKPQNGESILLTGSVNYYAKGGKLTFNANKIEKFGIGKLYEQFLIMKEKLSNEGLFDEHHKKKLPSEIKRVGVVTSKTGAVIQDIRNVGFRRNKNIEIVLYPVKVQGEGAENEIAEGIEFFDNYNVDVIIVARGGGSAEDLQPFNTEIVARKVYECNKPVVSAVGHETDFTIIDFVADLRAPTPSAAAELVFDDLQQLSQKIKMLNIRLINNINYSIDKAHTILEKNTTKLSSLLSLKIINSEQKLNKISFLLNQSTQILLNNKENMLARLNQSLNSLNPENIFKLGYSLVSKNNLTINSVKQIHENDDLKLTFIDGSINIKITKLEK